MVVAKEELVLRAGDGQVVIGHDPSLPGGQAKRASKPAEKQRARPHQEDGPRRRTLRCPFGATSPAVAGKAPWVSVPGCQARPCAGPLLMLVASVAAGYDIRS